MLVYSAIRPQTVSVKRKVTIMIQSGIITEAVGIILIAIVKMSSLFLPRNFTLTNVNAESEARTKLAIVEAAATIVLFIAAEGIK